MRYEIINFILENILAYTSSTWPIFFSIGHLGSNNSKAGQEIKANY